MLHRDERDEAVAVAEAKANFEARMAARFDAGRAANAAVIAQIDRDGDALTDMIVPTNGENGMRFIPADRYGLSVVVGTNGNARPFHLHPHAAGQAAERAGMPRSFMTRLLAEGEWARELLALTLNECFQHQKRDRCLLRAVGDEVRGMLSPAYKRLDSRMILGRFLAEVNDCGARVARATLDTTRFYVEAFLPHIFPVQTARNGIEYVAVGVVYSTSDYGDGADECRCIVERAWCTNRAITCSRLRTVHLGRRMEGFNVEWSRETYVRDSIAQASAVADIVRSSLDVDRVRGLLTAVQAAGANEVDLDAGFTKLMRAGCTESEVEAASKLLAAGDPAVVGTGPLTTWKLGQAVAAVANSTESVRRRYEIEQIAGKLMGLR